MQSPTCLTMGLPSRETWAQRLGAFRASPSAFMAAPEGEDLGRELLSDLRSERLSEQTKVGRGRPPLPWPRGLLRAPRSDPPAPVPRCPCWP